MPLVEHAIDQVAVADEVDLLDARGAVGHAGAREQRVDRAAALVDGGVDRRLVGQVDVDGLGAGQRDLGEVHDHDLGAGALQQLGRGRAHAGGATDDDGALAVVAECIERRHVDLSFWCVRSACGDRRWSDQATTPRTLRSTIVSQSRPSSARMASPCSLSSGARPAGAGSPSNWTGAATSWNGDAVGGLAVLDVAVGDGLGIDRGLERVLHDGPLADEVGQPLAPLGQGALGEDLARGSRWPPRLFAISDGVVGEARVGGQLGPADGLAERRPSTCRPAGR